MKIGINPEDENWDEIDAFIAISPDHTKARFVTKSGDYNIVALPALVDAMKGILDFFIVGRNDKRWKARKKAELALAKAKKSFE